MSSSRIITGIIFLIGGIVLMVLSFTISLFILIYGIPIFLVGIFLLLNKNEDKIEKRKDLKEKEYRK